MPFAQDGTHSDQIFDFLREKLCRQALEYLERDCSENKGAKNDYSYGNAHVSLTPWSVGTRFRH